MTELTEFNICKKYIKKNIKFQLIRLIRLIQLINQLRTELIVKRIFKKLLTYSNQINLINRLIELIQFYRLN